MAYNCTLKQTLHGKPAWQEKEEKAQIEARLVDLAEKEQALTEKEQFAGENAQIKARLVEACRKVRLQLSNALFKLIIQDLQERLQQA
jgi:hypothetical protein